MAQETKTWFVQLCKYVINRWLNPLIHEYLFFQTRFWWKTFVPILTGCSYFQEHVFMVLAELLALLCMDASCLWTGTNAIRKPPQLSAALSSIWQAVNSWDYFEPTSEIRPQCCNFRNNILLTDMLCSRHGRIFLSLWNTVLVLYFTLCEQSLEIWPDFTVTTASKKRISPNCK